jgi:hypothetical protein
MMKIIVAFILATLAGFAILYCLLAALNGGIV